MKCLIFSSIIVFPILVFSQQDSKVKIHSGNHNNVSVTQKGIDSLQKSDVDITHGDSNKVVQEQLQNDRNKMRQEENQRDSLKTENKHSRFDTLINDSTSVTKFFESLFAATIAGFAIYRLIKENTKKK